MIIDNFLSSTECREVIETARLRLIPSTTWNIKNSRSQLSDYRKSNQMFFKLSENTLVRSIEERIADLTHIPIWNGEGLQVVQYVKGGYYKVHCDYFNPMWEGNRFELKRVGILP